MYLNILNDEYSFGTKILFAMIRMVSRHPLPDAAKLVFYRSDFYGKPMKKFTHAAMRGPSDWSVGDRELMAAYISKLNECKFCIGAHTAVASLAYRDEAKVSAVLSNPETAPISEALKATLRLLEKLTKGHKVNAGDMRSVLITGVSHKQIEEALAIYFAFNTTDRLADAFGFEIPDAEGFKAGAKVLLKRGYH